MKMSQADWLARAEAYMEAAEHLRQCWTDDPREIEQGFVVAERLEKMADQCFGCVKCGSETGEPK